MYQICNKKKKVVSKRLSDCNKSITKKKNKSITQKENKSITKKKNKSITKKKNKAIKNRDNKSMCDEFDKITILAGTILYNGIDLPTNKCPPKYKYKHSNTYDNKYILYTADDINAARGYAGSCVSNKIGFIRYYRVLHDITLADISADQTQYEVQEVINEFSDCDGYYLDWGGDFGKEIVFCDPKNKLEFMGLYKCLGKGEYNTYKCNNNQSGGKKKTKDKKYNKKSVKKKKKSITTKKKKDKRLGKYKHKNHTHKTKKLLNNCKK